MTTNYTNTLITIAPDSDAEVAVAPPDTNPTVASQQYAMISANPYVYTSDDVIFARVAEKEGISEEDLAEARAAYFAKGRACMRASPLPKKFGWGIHADSEGRIALVAMESKRYAELVDDSAVKKTPAMRTSR